MVEFSGSIFDTGGGMLGCGGTPAEEAKKPSAAEQLLNKVVDASTNPADDCNRSFPEEERRTFAYHLCLLETHLRIHEDFKKAQLLSDLERNEAAVKALDPETSFWDDPWQAIKEYIFSLSERVSFQSQNWLLTDAAAISFRVFNLTQDRQYLQKAEHYLDQALAHEDRSVCFDIFRSPTEPTIWPIEGYFEIQLTRLQIYQIIDPDKFYTRADELRGKLESIRFLQAQRSNAFAAEGYLNRLNTMETELLFFMDKISAPAALPLALTGYSWFRQKRQENAVILAANGMSLKDLRYGELRSQNLAGKILREENTADSIARAERMFKGVLAAPEATRKYGGFLDLGLDAFFNLALIALSNSPSKAAAAEKFSRMADWKNLPADLREALGFQISEVNFCWYFSHGTRRSCPDLKDTLGNRALELGEPDLAPEDTRTVISKIPLDEIDDTEKMALILRAIDIINIESTLREEISARWQVLPEVN